VVRISSSHVDVLTELSRCDYVPQMPGELWEVLVYRGCFGVGMAVSGRRNAVFKYAEDV
jgi:hypothetical protein